MRNLRIKKSKADHKLAHQIRKCIRKDKFHKLQALTADIHPDSILNSKGQNGIHLSSKYGNPDCLNFFIRKGTDKRLTDKKGNIGLHYSAKSCILIQNCSQLLLPFQPCVHPSPGLCSGERRERSDQAGG